MILELAEKTTAKLKNMNIITHEEEIYKYGMAILISYSISVTIILIIGFTNRNIPDAILYLLCFDKIRSYSGGYHANTYFKCISCFILLYVVHLIIIKYIPYWILLIICLILFFSIFNYFPIDHPNKRLSTKERNIHGSKAKKRIIGLLFISIFFNDTYYFGRSICSVLIIILILCIIQLYINKEET